MARIYDSENQRVIDRIMCIRQARDAGATFINRQCIAKKTQSSSELGHR
jgi:hypothetical protein